MRYINLRFTYLLTYLLRYCITVLLYHCTVFYVAIAVCHVANKDDDDDDCHSKVNRRADNLARWCKLRLKSEKRPAVCVRPIARAAH